MPVGANGRRNDGSIQSAEWRCNGSKKMQRLHQRLGYINRTLQADIVKPTSLEKNINNLKKIKFYVMKK